MSKDSRTKGNTMSIQAFPSDERCFENMAVIAEQHKGMTLEQYYLGQMLNGVHRRSVSSADCSEDSVKLWLRHAMTIARLAVEVSQE